MGAEAEVDFGKVSFLLAGVQVDGWMFVLRISASGRGFHRVYLNQAQQAFLDGHARAVEHMGGVPGRIRYDNSDDVGGGGVEPDECEPAFVPYRPVGYTRALGEQNLRRKLDSAPFRSDLDQLDDGRPDRRDRGRNRHRPTSRRAGAALPRRCSARLARRRGTDRGPVRRRGGPRRGAPARRGRGAGWRRSSRRRR